ncbi:MAG: hypothetical protein ACP6IY_15815 [Promethearchaeia archaeon]
MVCCLSIDTSFHLWSRVPLLKDRIRKLFLFMGIIFFVICGIFTFLLVDSVLVLYGVNLISSI